MTLNDNRDDYIERIKNDKLIQNAELKLTPQEKSVWHQLMAQNPNAFPEDSLIQVINSTNSQIPNTPSLWQMVWQQNQQQPQQGLV